MVFVSRAALTGFAACAVCVASSAFAQNTDTAHVSNAVAGPQQMTAFDGDGVALEAHSLSVLASKRDSQDKSRRTRMNANISEKAHAARTVSYAITVR
jgi:parvulin-like peptidyl-prolyl isomerase